jgi:hypothetical protein
MCPNRPRRLGRSPVDRRAAGTGFSARTPVITANSNRPRTAAIHRFIVAGIAPHPAPRPLDQGPAGERQGHRRYREAVERAGLDYQILRNYAWMAGRFELSCRRDSLSFGHHAEVAPMPGPERDFWLRPAQPRADRRCIASLGPFPRRRAGVAHCRRSAWGGDSARRPVVVLDRRTVLPQRAARRRVAAGSARPRRRGLLLPQLHRRQPCRACGARQTALRRVAQLGAGLDEAGDGCPGVR